VAVISATRSSDDRSFVRIRIFRSVLAPDTDGGSTDCN
jgi:hypothetical protein